MLSSKYPISFILPIYNVGKYLNEAIQSIINQKIEKEIILVDDGSTDNSLEIALYYAHQYSFISVIHSHNQGVSAARNKGITVARGEYILFLDPDDILNDKADFKSTYDLAKKYNIQVVKGQFVSYFLKDEINIYRREPIFSSVQSNQVEICTLPQFLQKMLEVNWFIQGGCFLIERTFLLQNKLFYDERLFFGEDGIFITNVLSLEGRLMEVPFLFMNYRLRNDSVVAQPISEKRLDSEILSINLLMEKIVLCKNEELKHTLTGILAMFCFFLHRDIKEINEKNSIVLLDKYKNAVTSDMIRLYQSWGIQFTQLDSSNNR